MRAVFVVLWLAWGAFWIARARSVKAVRQMETPFQRLVNVVAIVLAGALLAAPGTGLAALDAPFIPASYGIAAFGALLTAAGLAFAVWARMTLGGNWSGSVTVKRDHTLVMEGPYAWVRHPIYTGLLLAFLGSALALGEWRGLVAVAIAGGALWWKLRREEAFMAAEFGAAYDAYARRVPALIPFVA